MKKNRYHIIIGGTSEIGVSIINKFMKKGRNVLFSYFNNDALAKNILSTYKDYDSSIKLFKLDVRNQQDINTFSNYISKKEIQIESLVYNSGIIEDSMFYSMSEETFLSVMDTNLNGCFRVCKALINNISINKGKILIMSSISALIPKMGQINYSCSKIALISLTRNLAQEYGKLNVRVNCIAPGLIKGKMINSIPIDELNKMKKNIPLKRFGSTDDVANGSYFLTSNMSDYITGQTLIIDGGLVMQ